MRKNSTAGLFDARGNNVSKTINAGHSAHGSDVFWGTGTLGYIFPIWRHGWHWIIGCAMLGLIAGVAFLLSGPSYETTMSVAPNQESSASGETGRGLSNLASVVGMGPSDNQPLNPYQQFIITLHSKDLAQALMGSGDIVRLMFHPRWNSNLKAWVKQSSSLSYIARSVDAVFGFKTSDALNIDDIQRYLKERIAVASNKDDSVRVISIRTKDPLSGFKLLTAIYENADMLVRRSDASRFSEQVNFITSRLTSVTVAEHREALSNLLSDYEKKLLLAQSTLNYASRIIDRPQIAQYPATPRPLLVLFVAPILGLCLGAAIATVRFMKRTARSQ